MKLFLLIGVLFVAVNCQNLTVMAWNVQIFGASKMSNPDVVRVLVPTFRKYDISIIQEIREASGASIQLLLSLINNCNFTTSPCPQFGLVLSDRLGSTTSKEQYGFFYKKDKPKMRINVTHMYQYPDPNYQSFERPPYNVRFTVNNFNFSLSAIHTQPTSAVSEIDKLVDVYDHISTNVNMNMEKNSIILGDFNAGCSYVPNSQWANIRLRTQSRFTWFFGDNVRTNVALSCPYDRMVATSGIVARYVNGSALVDRFDLTFGLTSTQTADVSDHFPIAITLNIPEIPPPSNNTTYLCLSVLLFVFLFI